MESSSYRHVGRKPSSPTLSSFSLFKILPSVSPFPAMDGQDECPATTLQPVDSASELNGPSGEELFYERRFSTDEAASYDLRPPPPTVSHANAERLSEYLFSANHLNIILKDHTLFQRFTNFLNRYRPHSAPVLVRYLESQKALTAIRYANALAEQIVPSSRNSSWGEAAGIDVRLENISVRAMDELIGDALPAYITCRVVSLATDCLVREITGNNTSEAKQLVQGLAEVYCLTDPSMPDNPIVFASEEFFNTTQYGREYVIGKNCRFLQGPRTQAQAVKRISQALRNGQEICEILLNYRRDGTPFLNLVMMAPLMDARGNIRYFIGCQIDITNLVEESQGLESFRTLLEKDQERPQTPVEDPLDARPPLKVLREFGGLLNDEEIEIMGQHDRQRKPSIDSSTNTPGQSICHPMKGTGRRFVGMDEPEPEPNLWPSPHLGSSGRLPGVYQNYLLVRPYPSLRIIFTSAALRIPGLSQSKLMDRIGGPQHVRESLMEALAQGIGVTAKISWITQTQSPFHIRPSFESVYADSDHVESELVEGKPRWIHCTPLQGSDGKPGVIMVVMVDKEELGGTAHIPKRIPSRVALRGSDHTKEWPLRGMGVSAANARFTPGKLYADYLRREGRTTSTGMKHEEMNNAGDTRRTSMNSHSIGRPSITMDEAGGILMGGFGSGSESAKESRSSTPHGRRSATLARWVAGRHNDGS